MLENKWLKEPWMQMELNSRHHSPTAMDGWYLKGNIHSSSSSSSSGGGGYCNGDHEVTTAICRHLLNLEVYSVALLLTGDSAAAACYKL
jgi:hypothetical protein